MSATMVAWQRKSFGWSCQEWLEIFSVFLGEGDVSFHNKLFPP